MEKVFLARAERNGSSEVSEAARKVFDALKINFEGKIPLKVHFGEKGNITFIKPTSYQGIINSLKEKKVESFFTDTNVLYKGERTTREKHIALAKEHGFTQLPIIIADGEMGEENVKVKISGKHYKECSIGKTIADSKQMVVLAHFKGHFLPGFGGAIKQLSMGCASRGGKLAMHAHSTPILNPLKCIKCNTCANNCPVDACIISKIPHIDKKKCIGCAKCIAVCPTGAMTINWVSTGRKEFIEKLCEYALAAQKDKEIAYVNFVLDVTKNCDCEGHPQKPIIKDLGILASKDPVALDKACMDLLRKREGKKIFSGDHNFDYGEKIGLGKKEYELVEL